MKCSRRARRWIKCSIIHCNKRTWKQLLKTCIAQRFPLRSRGETVSHLSRRLAQTYHSAASVWKTTSVLSRGGHGDNNLIMTDSHDPRNCCAAVSHNLCRRWFHSQLFSLFVCCLPQYSGCDLRSPAESPDAVSETEGCVFIHFSLLILVLGVKPLISFHCMCLCVCVLSCSCVSAPLCGADCVFSCRLMMASLQYSSCQNTESVFAHAIRLRGMNWYLKEHGSAF